MSDRAFRRLMHEDDVALYFSTPEEAHGVILQANAHAKTLARDPDNEGKRFFLIVGIDRETLSDRQRKFLHGPVLGQLSEQAKVNGERYVFGVWKQFFKKLYLGHTYEMVKLPGQKRATPRKVPIKSEDLSVKQYAEWTDKIIAYAVTELGVVFELDPREREAVRYRPTVRKARPAPAKKPLEMVERVEPETLALPAPEEATA